MTSEARPPAPGRTYLHRRSAEIALTVRELRREQVYGTLNIGGKVTGMLRVSRGHLERDWRPRE